MLTDPLIRGELKPVTLVASPEAASREAAKVREISISGSRLLL
jgi:hypothetical protein